MLRALGVLSIMLSACAVPEPAAEADPVAFGEPTARFLSDDLLQIFVPVEVGLPTAQQARDVTDCAAAVSANRRDVQFARHIRTSLSEPVEEGDNADDTGIRTVDAVYTLSEALPRGDFVIDVAVFAETCDAAAEDGLNG